MGECPNKKHCKNKEGLIRFLNKSGYKHPHSYLRVCVAKVSTAVGSYRYYTHNLDITFPTVTRRCVAGDLLSNHQSKDPAVKNEFLPKDRRGDICSYPKGCKDLQNDQHDHSKEFTSRNRREQRL